MSDNKFPRTPGRWHHEGSAAIYDIQGHRLLLADREAGNGTTPAERDSNVRFASFAPQMAEILVNTMSNLRAKRCGPVTRAFMADSIEKFLKEVGEL